MSDSQIRGLRIAPLQLRSSGALSPGSNCGRSRVAVQERRLSSNDHSIATGHSTTKTSGRLLKTKEHVSNIYRNLGDWLRLVGKDVTPNHIMSLSCQWRIRHPPFGSNAYLVRTFCRHNKSMSIVRLPAIGNRNASPIFKYRSWKHVLASRYEPRNQFPHTSFPIDRSKYLLNLLRGALPPRQ